MIFNKQLTKFFFFLGTTLFLCADSSKGLSSNDFPSIYSLESSDKLQFGRLWQQIKRLQEKKTLYPMILERRKEISTIKNHWKVKISHDEGEGFLSNLQMLLTTGSLKPSNYGCGAAYFLYDHNDIPKYVVKPFDEDILCLNNRKQFASPFNGRAFRVRDHIPLYRSAQAEALSYAVAQVLDYLEITPETHMAVITHDAFFDISDHLTNPEDLDLKEKLGIPDREKLCSIQAYQPNIQNLYNIVEEWLADHCTEEQILSRIDQNNFEKICLLIWLLYDTDAHAGNLYATKKADGKFNLLKVDNGLTFPNQNSHLLNALHFFPHAKKNPSTQFCETVAYLPQEKIEEKIHYFEMDDCLEAFRQRIHILKKLTKKGDLSLREIDMRLRVLEIPNGADIALSEITLADLEKLISY